LAKNPDYTHIPKSQELVTEAGHHEKQLISIAANEKQASLGVA